MTFANSALGAVAAQRYRPAIFRIRAVWPDYFEFLTVVRLGVVNDADFGIPSHSVNVRRFAEVGEIRERQPNPCTKAKLKN